MAGSSPHKVVGLVLPGVVLLDLAAPEHLFGFCGTARYAWSLATPRPGRVPTATGMELLIDDGLEALATAGTIVIPGTADPTRSCPEPLLEALRVAHDRGARLLSICTGAYVLAEAGLLDGRRATTHWHEAPDLAARYPGVTVDPGVLFVDEGQVLTSAGVASGLDLCLHVVRRDHGAAVAASIARRTVVAPHRDGGQAQYIERPIVLSAPAPAGAVALEATRAWALERLDQPLPVEALAAHACVSPRTFARRFRAETGTTPAAWVTDQRVALARRLLEQTELSVDDVATQSGLGSAASLREHLARHAKTTPTAYRRAFRTGSSGLAA